MKFNIVPTDLSWFEVDDTYNYAQVYHPLMWGHWNGKVEDNSAESCFALFRCRDYWTEILAGLATGKDQPTQYLFTYKVDYNIDTSRTKLVIYSPEKGFSKFFRNLEQLEKFLSNFHDEDITLYYDEAKQLILLDANYWWMNSHTRIGLLTGCIRIKHDFVNMCEKDVLEPINGKYIPNVGYEKHSLKNNIQALQYLLNYRADSTDWVERTFSIAKEWGENNTNIFRFCYAHKNPGYVHGYGNVRTMFRYHLLYNPEFQEVLKVKEAA